MAKRTFEHADGKFWEIWMDGDAIYTRFGKLDAKGQTRFKQGSAIEVDAQIADKVKHGFVEHGGAKPAATGLDANELKRLLKGIKTADDPGILVLADWLQTQNHPWGELIVTQHTATTTPKKAASLIKAADKLIEARRADILGPLADVPDSTFDWTNGFLRRASIGCNAEPKAIAKAVKLLLAQPIAQVIETIAINTYVAEFPFWNDWGVSRDHIVDPWTDLGAIAKLIPARVTRVGFGGWPAAPASAYVRMPTFTAISKTFPQLTGLELTGTCADKPGKLSLKELVELEVRFAEGGQTGVDAIVASNLSKLQRLSVWFGGHSSVLVDDVYSPDEYDEDNEGGSRYPATFSATDLAAMHIWSIDTEPNNVNGWLKALLGMKLPALVHFGVPSSGISPDVIATLAKSKLLPQLKTLDLSNSTLDDDGVKALVAAKKQLAHLERLDVSDCKLTISGADKLAKALPNAHVGKVEAAPKKKPKGRAYYDYNVKTTRPLYHFRYVAAME